MESYHSDRAQAMPVVRTMDLQPDPPAVTAFRKLVAARLGGDCRAIRPLTAELLGLGWVVFAVEPRKAGKAVRS